MDSDALMVEMGQLRRRLMPPTVRRYRSRKVMDALQCPDPISGNILPVAVAWRLRRLLDSRLAAF